MPDGPSMLPAVEDDGDGMTFALAVEHQFAEQLFPCGISGETGRAADLSSDTEKVVAVDDDVRCHGDVSLAMGMNSVNWTRLREIVSP